MIVVRNLDTSAFSLCGVSKWIILLFALAGSGCAGSIERSPTWLYHWHGHTSNLSGCMDDRARDLDPFFGAWVKVLRRNSGHFIIIIHTSQPPTTVLLAINAANASASGTWNVNSHAGTLRAWLVRMPQSVFDYEMKGTWAGTGKGSPFENPNEVGMIALADGTKEKEEDGLLFPMSGSLQLTADAEKLLSVKANLVTATPVPVYKQYFEFVVRSYRDQHDPAVEHVKECMKRSSLGPATIDGEMRGEWVPGRAPML